MNKLNLFILLASFSVALCMYDGNSKVIKLTSANFKEKVINSKELWFVEFYAPWCGHCQRLEPEYEKLAKSLEGIIRVGAVDMDADREAGAPYGIKGFPTIKFFGADKSKPLDYNGGRTAKELMDYAFSQARNVADTRLSGKSGSSSSSSSSGSQGGAKASSDKDVVILTDSNFDELVMHSEDLWLVEFYAPWCGHCKRLEPEWSDAATKLKGEVKIGKVDATVEQRLASRFSISGYPTIKLFPTGSKSDSNVEDYEGARDSSTIVSWALEKKAQYKPVSKVEQLASQEEFDNYCANQRGVCLIGFLPHILDSSAEERNRYIEMFKELAKSHKANPVTFLWAQGGDHWPMEEALALGSGYPSLVAISVNKNKFSTLRATFDKKNIDTFITALLAGKESLLPLPQLPKLKNVSRWDGRDAPRQETEL